MFNIFEQPWTLLIVAAVVLFIILIFRRFKPEKRRWWQLVIPLLIAVSAFAIDTLVVTDFEKIDGILKNCIKATINRNSDVIDSFIASDYHDSLHQGKRDLTIYFRAILSEPAVKRFVNLDQSIKLTPSDATVLFKGYLFFDERSRFYKELKPAMELTLQLELKKYSDKNWQIYRGEILEIDNQHINWNEVQSLP